MEQLKGIVGYEGLYSIDTSGSITRDSDGKLMKPFKNTKGRLQIKLTKNGERRAHCLSVLVWEAFMGSRNGLLIDHIDRDLDNNSLDNLRLCATSQNGANRGAQKNNTLGIKGVRKIKDGVYDSRIGYRGKTFYLGRFKSKEDAQSIYKSASLYFFREFSIYNQ